MDGGIAEPGEEGFTQGLTPHEDVGVLHVEIGIASSGCCGLGLANLPL